MHFKSESLLTKQFYEDLMASLFNIGQVLVLIHDIKYLQWPLRICQMQKMKSLDIALILLKVTASRNVLHFYFFYMKSNIFIKTVSDIITTNNKQPE